MRMAVGPPCILILAALTGPSACRAKPEHAAVGLPVAKNAARTPWAMQPREQPIHVDVMGGHWQFDGGALLVGCKEELSVLTPLDRALAALRGVRPT